MKGSWLSDCASGCLTPLCSISDSPCAVSVRNCPTEIILLVWRLVPQVKSGHDGMIRRSSCKSAYDLQSPPNKREKNSTMPPRAEQRRSCHVLYDGSDGLVLNGWERYTEIGKPSPNTMPPLSRVPSAADQNYIILAPLNPGSQVGRPSSPTLELTARGCWLCLLGSRLAHAYGASPLRVCWSTCHFSKPELPWETFCSVPKAFTTRTVELRPVTCCLLSGLAQRTGVWEVLPPCRPQHRTSLSFSGGHKRFSPLWSALALLGWAC